MKYRYHLIIEKDGKPLLESSEGSIARSEIGILKAVRRSINSTIKQDINHIEGKSIDE